MTSFEFDPYSEAVSRDPYPFYARMRAEHPVFWCESTRAWALSRYDDVSYEEIGEILELSVPAVKSVIFRARTDLREKLRQYLEA